MALNVRTPEPKLEEKKPKFKQIELDPDQRSFERTQSLRLKKINRKMDTRNAYRDIIVTEESDSPHGIDMSEEGVRMGDILPGRSGVRGAGRRMKGGRSQLVEFVDKSRGKRRIIYCMDVSASMEASNKLNLARNYLKDSLLALNSRNDKFNVIAFANGVVLFRPGDPIQATEENVAGALDFLDQYTARNIQTNTKTDLLSPLMRALEMKPSVIVLVTDGLPTAGTTHPEKIIQSIREMNASNTVRIFAIGMEMDVEQPEGWLLRTIAEQNNGEFQFL